MNISWFRKNVIWTLEYKLNNIKSYFYNKKMKKKYPDYENNEYNCGSLKHIWGITSWDDLSGKEASLYTMNDIDITYDRDTKSYSLGIETAYVFKDNEAECRYLRRLLDAFSKFMDEKGYSKEYIPCLFFENTTVSNKAETIVELYANFRMYVEGFCKVSGYTEVE